MLWISFQSFKRSMTDVAFFAPKISSKIGVMLSPRSRIVYISFMMAIA